jgi:hypothetical protein
MSKKCQKIHLWQPLCAYMQFAVIYMSFAVIGYKALHGVTWRYIFFYAVMWKYCCQRGGCNW